MRKLFIIGSFFILIFRSQGIVKAQSLKDTIKLQTIQIVVNKLPGRSYERRSFIDSLTIARSSTIRLSELVLQNSPIYIKEYGRGAMATASFRGTAPSHTKVFWNGVELNSPMLGMVDFSLIPVYFSEKVSLLHGSSSLSESAGALGGTIVLENKADWSANQLIKVIGSYGSFGSYDAFGQLTIGHKKLKSKYAVYYNASENDFSYLNKLNADIDPISGTYHYPTDKNKNAEYKNYGVLQELYYQSLKNQTYSLQTWIQHNERGLPQLLTNESNDAANINKQRENALRSAFEWKKIVDKSRLLWHTSLNIQNSIYQLENNVNGESRQLVINASAKYTSLGNKLSYRNQFSRSITLISEIGTNFYWVETHNEVTSSSLTGYTHSKTENSIFTSLEKQWNPQLVTSFVFREELDNLRHVGILPLVKIRWKPLSSNQLSLYFSGAKNIHRPSLNDLYYIPGGNPNLRSEKSTQYDFGIANNSPFQFGTISSEISIFSSQTTDWILWLPTFQGYWEPRNIPLVQSKGVEANVDWNGEFGPIRSRVNGHYAHTQTQNNSTESAGFGKQLPYIPKNSANIGLLLSGFGFYLNWNWNYYSKRYTTTANSEDTATDYLYPYFMNNIQLGHEIKLKTCKLMIDFKINNLFNEEYRTVLQRPMPGRNYQIILSYGI